MLRAANGARSAARPTDLQPQAGGAARSGRPEQREEVSDARSRVDEARRFFSVVEPASGTSRLNTLQPYKMP